jgi:SAM-dependent methyltransferase
MTASFPILKRVYRLLPKPLREAKGLKRLALHVLEQTGHLNDIYSQRYYQTMVEPYAQKSVPQMAASIVGTFHPARVIDIGCGSGALLVELRKLGVRNLIGLDASEAGLEIAAARGLDTRQFDICSETWNEPLRFDLAVSMEVAEHLPASAAGRYIDLLCSLAPVIVFTAAPPGQGGIGHLNEQPPGYWQDFFTAHGFRLCRETVAAWQADWHAAGVAGFYTENLMIFRQS